MKFDATVIIPWRPAPDRLKPYARVRKFWAHHGFQVIAADSRHNLPFHAAQARNWGAAQAFTSQLIFCDADTVPDIASVLTALTVLDDDMIYPFTDYRLLPEWSVDQADLLSIAPTFTYPDVPGGIFVIGNGTYWGIGGMDERFEPCWGYEDSAFRIAAKTLSTVRRVEGLVFAFDHYADRNMSSTNPNQARHLLYEKARFRPEQMRDLIEGKT